MNEKSSIKTGDEIALLVREGDGRSEGDEKKRSEDGRNGILSRVFARDGQGDTRRTSSLDDRAVRRLAMTPKKGSLLGREAREERAVSLAGATPTASSASSPSSSARGVVARVGAAGAFARHAHLRESLALMSHWNRESESISPSTRDEVRD